MSLCEELAVSEMTNITRVTEAEVKQLREEIQSLKEELLNNNRGTFNILVLPN